MLKFKFSQILFLILTIKGWACFSINKLNIQMNVDFHFNFFELVIQIMRFVAYVIYSPFFLRFQNQILKSDFHYSIIAL